MLYSYPGFLFPIILIEQQALIKKWEYHLVQLLLKHKGPELQHSFMKISVTTNFGAI